MLHKVLNASSAPQLPQHHQKQIDILETTSAPEDLLSGSGVDNAV